MVRKAADWGISYAAGSDEKKAAFLEDVAQGKDRDFLREVLDAYACHSGDVDLRGNCGLTIGGREYRNQMERKVFHQDLPSTMDDYATVLRDALEQIADQIRSDLAQNERENNYITDANADRLREAADELGHCGVSTGFMDSAIDRLAWFVGGDSSKIHQLQQKLNELGIGQGLEEDGVYGEKTDAARSSLWDELIRGTFPTLAWIDPLQSNMTGIRSATKTTADGRTFSRLVAGGDSRPLFRADLHPYKGKRQYYHVNVDTLPTASSRQINLAKRLDHTEISKEAYDILKNFRNSGKIVRIGGRVLVVAGTLLDTLELCSTIDDDLHDADRKIGKKTYSATADIGGSWIGSALGAKGGALAGAAIGSAILPGVGTAIGGIAGGLILGVAGSFAGSSLGKWVIDITEIGE